VPVHINIVAVGKIKEQYLREGIHEYLKRLRPYARIEIREVAEEKLPEKASPAEEDLIRRKEGERILGLLPTGSYTVVLGIEGRSLTSPELADLMDKLGLAGKSEINFVIGGSLGLSQAVLAPADVCLSLSRLTFPHQLMRLILLEQIYRAFKISRGEPYHK
jgi:23S rRNA (pseudouridine1915-N3)-methyltransferase